MQAMPTDDGFPAPAPLGGAVRRALLATLVRLAPDRAVNNGLQPAWISRDPAVVRAYQADPRVHDRITPRLARFSFILDGGALVRARGAVAHADAADVGRCRPLRRPARQCGLRRRGAGGRGDH
jgi:alpha-beta hydrolase superfamily lysophospholipase